ncbi:hypothetical protein GGR50DRAFT_232651 [Xylaria sp. CBS 124048]|nr:hypothetical protein GGR50DRAFT_232651 [Xylaria sp. CBS 124048]
MDGQPVVADSEHIYPAKTWTRSVSSPAVPRLSTLQAPNPPEVAPAHCDPHLDLVPILFPQQSSLYQAKLLQYNKLIAPGRGGGLQTPPLPPIISSQPVHADSRSRSLSKVSNKDSRTKHNSQNCHGNRGNQNTNKADRALITGKGTNSKMPSKKPDTLNGLPSKPKSALTSSHIPPHSSSVPSTPHQHGRKFSFGSREQSPNANRSHSPRSVHSETNGVILSLQPLPPRGAGCKHETGLKFSRRRIPYNIGTDPLEKVDLNNVKNKLSEDDERKLTTDMRELYDRLQPTEAVETKRQKLVQKLEKLLNDTWPGHDIRVHLFGSSGNLLCSDDSDVDICIVTPWKKLEGVCMLADLLAKHGMQKVVCVASAKVPIVKIWDPELELNCDMNVNNTLALENTRMIKTYVEIDERVRPLAMIVKYWTRRRILNDAAFGGTLSSYTWICMIIAFLQLRQPPILPVLHQQPHQRVPRQNGEIAAFTDNIDELRGFGSRNQATLGELLFEFFRFYAHEFDYSTNVLSVRLGRLITKRDKKWDLALNNQLCVEEPFNTNRNLGNTADDTAFRGIHIELRRAFDAIARGSLEDCCEQFVYPKEEERIFQKPPPVSRPVPVRSASQQQSNRSNRGGGYRPGARHPNRSNGNHNHNNNNNSNRRASSVVNYENPTNPTYMPTLTSMPIGNQDANSIYLGQPELVAQLSALHFIQENSFIQENNMRFVQYTRSPAFKQHALPHAQRMQGATQQSQTTTDRSRTNSFDNPPLSGPNRFEMPPEMYGYHFTTQRAHPGHTAYLSASSGMGNADYRRSSHQSTAANDAGHGPSGSNVRSQSQPAFRPMAATPSTQNVMNHGQMQNGFTGAPTRHVNSIPIPSFIPDDGNDNEQKSPAADSPDDGKSSTYYTNPSSPRGTSGTTNGIPAFGDIGSQSESSDQRYLSSDEFTPHVSGRTFAGSRSPSPNSQEAAYLRSSNSGSLATASFSPNHLNPETAPLVVNGSKSRISSSPRQTWYGETLSPSNFAGYENPLQIHQDSSSATQPGPGPDPSIPPAKTTSPISDRPVVVNGSRPTSIIVAPHTGLHYTNETVTLHSDGTLHVGPWYSGFVPYNYGNQSTRLLQRFPPIMHSPLIAQLDLATGQNEMHTLSPVYEAKSPPIFPRKHNPPSENPARTMYPNQKRREGTSDASRTHRKVQVETPTPEAEGSTHANPTNNEHGWKNDQGRSAKSEGDHSGASNTWQKSRGRKRVDPKGRGEVSSQSEQPPKNDADRKGG